MASGDLILSLGPHSASFPAANPAQVAVRNTHPSLAFDTTTGETAYFDNLVWPPQFPAASGCTVKVFAAFATATANAAVFQVSFERIGTVLDIDADSFATAKELTVTANATSGIHGTGTVAFTQAEMDSIADGETFRIRLVRDVADAGDTAAGDCQVAALALLVT